MGLQLSSELRFALEFCGMSWPGTDEQKVAAWAGDWRALAGGNDGAIDLEGAVVELAKRNEGPGIQAFVAHINETDSAMRRYVELSQGCEALAQACQLIATIILTLKIAVITQLASLALAIGGAISSGGLATAGVLVAKRLASEAIQRLIEGAVAELLAE